MSHLVVADLGVLGPARGVEGVVDPAGLFDGGSDTVDVERLAAAVEPQPLHHQRKARHVIGVFVGDDEGVDLAGLHVTGHQALYHVTAAVDHHHRIAPLEGQHGGGPVRIGNGRPGAE